MNNFLKYIAAAPNLAIMAFFISVGPSAADEVYPFRVAFEDIPGTEHLVPGNLTQGIQVLEQELESGASNEGYLLATLCGAYILNQNLDKAEKMCADAVNRFPGDAAYNNRAVLRAFRGDIEGARRDFDRARPPNMLEYLEILRKRDIGLVANGNHELLQKLTANHSPDDIRSSFASIQGANIEILDD